MINGNKILIRQLESGDEEYLHRWWNNEEMMQHATHVFGTLQSKESIRSNIMEQIQNYNMFPHSKRFIICRREGIEPIGEINYCDWDIRNQKCEIGIKICELMEQRKGYGKDALYHFTDFLFRFLNLNKIELTTMIDNKKAQNLYKKLGYKEIGVIRQGYFDSRVGDFNDVVYMDLLKSDWLDIKDGIKLNI